MVVNKQVLSSNYTDNYIDTSTNATYFAAPNRRAIQSPWFSNLGFMWNLSDTLNNLNFNLKH